MKKFKSKWENWAPKQSDQGGATSDKLESGTNGTSVLEHIGPNHTEEYEERAAIMEFDGGLSREDAELQAAKILNRKYLRGGQ
jgi:hypothetical protein